MLDRVRADIRAIKERDPASRNSFEIVLLYSGLHDIVPHIFYTGINGFFLRAFFPSLPVF